MSRRGPRPFARALSVNFTLVAILPLAAVSVLVLGYLTFITERDITRGNQVLARAVSSQVEVYLRHPHSVLRNIKTLLQVNPNMKGEAIEVVLESHVRHSELFESIYLLGPEGKVRNIGLPDGVEKPKEDKSGLDLVHRDLFRRARETGGPAWSDTFRSFFSGKMSLAVALAVDARVLVGHFRIDFLTSFTERLNPGESVSTILVDRQGSIIVHPDPVVAARRVNIGGLGLVERGLKGHEGTERYSFEGERFLGSVALIGGPGWLVLVSRNMAESFGPVWRTGIILGVGLLVVALGAVLTALIMARRFSRPLTEFAARAAEVAEGDYDFSLPGPGYLEVSELASGFGRMTKAMQEREQSLRESEEKYRLLFENANDAIYIAQEGFIKFANLRTEEMTGFPSAYLARNPFSVFIHPEDREMVLARHTQRLEGEDVPSTYSFRILNMEGKEVWVLLNTVLITWEGKPATLNFLRDISEQKSLERQALQSQKLEAIGTLAGGIAHDFNNLLQTIQSYAEIILLHCKSEPQAREDLEEIVKAAERGGELTQQLLLFSRRAESRMRSLDLNEELERGARILERTLPKMIEIELNFAGDLKRINADPLQMEQVLMNLAVNARDAMPGTGKLSITTGNVFLDGSSAEYPGARKGEYVQLSVADTGQGMEEDVLAHIFNPFFTTKEAGKGTGLGLATVYGIVQSHQGYITCQSSPGRGTAFHIFLPVTDEEKEYPAFEETELPTGGTETILLVDDEKTIRDFGEKILGAFGYTVRAVPDGESALRLFCEEGSSIGLIILDMFMPGMGGKQCLKELLACDAEAKVLISTGSASGKTASEALEMGAKGIITKPYAVKKLLIMIRRILDKS